jgi:hypothetical protein
MLLLLHAHRRSTWHRGTHYSMCTPGAGRVLLLLLLLLLCAAASGWGLLTCRPLCWHGFVAEETAASCSNSLSRLLSRQTALPKDPSCSQCHCAACTPQHTSDDGDHAVCWGCWLCLCLPVGLLPDKGTGIKHGAGQHADVDGNTCTDQGAAAVGQQLVRSRVLCL